MGLEKLLEREDVPEDAREEIETHLKEDRERERENEDLRSYKRIIREVNLGLFNLESEEELYHDVCKSIVEGMEIVKFAWLGMLQNGGSEVTPVACAGHEDGYLSDIEVRHDDSVHGSGPMGQAMKNKEPVITNEVENDPIFERWREKALSRGYKAVACVPLILTINRPPFNEGESIGGLAVYSHEKNAFQEDEIELFREISGDIAVGIKSLGLERKLEERSEEMQRIIESTVRRLSEKSEERDEYTEGHQRRVSNLSEDIAYEMKLTEEEIYRIRIGAHLHDMGKMEVPLEILKKPGELTEEEFERVKEHCGIGYFDLRDLGFPPPIPQIALQHHERIDGSGYPEGLKGEDILLESRIVGVADVIDAMTSSRAYRDALPLEEALGEIRSGRGEKFDARVVDACLTVFENGFSFDETTYTREPVRDIEQRMAS